MGRIRLSPFRSVVPLSRPDAALSRLAASLHGAIVSTAGRERLREALREALPNALSLATEQDETYEFSDEPGSRYVLFLADALSAALAHDRPSGSGLREAAQKAVLEYFEWEDYQHGAPNVVRREMERLRTALSGSSDPEAVGLDEAWAEADAALPSDGSMRLTGVTWPSMKDDEWVAHCSAAGVFGYGPTPAAALHALAIRLTEAKPETPA
jgi:hypothetical protein